MRQNCALTWVMRQALDVDRKPFLLAANTHDAFARPVRLVECQHRVNRGRAYVAPVAAVHLYFYGAVQLATGAAANVTGAFFYCSGRYSHFTLQERA